MFGLGKLGKYDGNLVIVQDQDQIQNLAEPDTVYFQNPETEKFVPVDGRLLALYGLKWVQEKYGEVEGIQERVEKALEEVYSDQVQAEIHHLILKGRLRLSLLLNSSGGPTVVRDAIKVIHDLILGNKGKSYSFGGVEVGSAAAGLFLLPSSRRRRFMTDSSTLTLHHSNRADLRGKDANTPENESRDQEILSRTQEIERFGIGLYKLLGQYDRLSQVEKDVIDIRLREKQLLLETLLRHCKWHKRRRVRSKFIDEVCYSEERDCPISFSGKEAGKVGLAKNVGFIRKLEERFRRVNGVSDEAYQGTAIEQFFQDLRSKIFNYVFQHMAGKVFTT